jgi:acetolactate synthase I/III small subunit
MAGEARPRHHILSVLVENRAGVLARVASLFARRGFNIVSLTVAPTDDPALSHLTMVVDLDSAPLEQITKQLHKLINVIRISELDPAQALQRELLLATVAAGPERRSQVIELVELFHGEIVDVGADQLTIAVTAEPSRLDDFEDLLRVFGIEDLQRTGLAALPKLERRRSRPRSLGRIA